MNALRAVTCCFSGYRVEKMPFSENDTAAVAALAAQLDRAVGQAADEGYTRFLSGMSTGFDLWAAEAVLRVRDARGLSLVCAVPFEQQAQRFPPAWKRLFNRVLLAADQVFTLSREYRPGCYAVRNRFMVDASSLLLCYFDGQPGGTAQTVRMAEAAGLAVRNLAEAQLRLED